ncbi:MAG: tyrosine-type recombinase/integrase [Clostridia bacterium]|nr:tyrosine-type recombinase/integrase [Clostridia bacterium]
METTLNPISLAAFEQSLLRAEKSRATVEKYLRDLRRFEEYLCGEAADREKILQYKEELGRRYAISSANSMLAALNVYLHFCNRGDLCVKQFKMQRQAYCSEARELTRREYFKLVEAAQRAGNQRMSMLLQTVCGTGIRISELPFVTVESVTLGEVKVRCKGKTRTVFIIPTLRKRLLKYAAAQRIFFGPIFVTRGRKPMDRSNIWREMKKLCDVAGVPREKVFPHNLRHLFARTFYNLEKDIAKLADILGHSNINTTRIYIVTTGAEHRRRMENLHLIM